MADVHIGDGAIIAANSTIIKDVAPYPIDGSNPARSITRRFGNEVVEALLQLHWWKLPTEK